MVNLTRLATASPPVISAPDINSVLERIFYDCFEPVAEAIAVLIDSAPAGETHVADSLVSLASNQLRSNPTQNQAKLRAKALDDLKAVWVPVPPREQDLNSPLRMLGTLSYERATAFVLANFSRLDNYEIGRALRCTEAGARNHCRTALVTLQDRLREDFDILGVFWREAQSVANQVDADPQILERALKNLDPEALLEREPKRSPQATASSSRRLRRLGR